MSYIDTNGTSPSDITIDGVTLSHTSGGNKTYFTNGTRWTIMNCDISGQDWVSYGSNVSHMIWANNKLHSSYAEYYGGTGQQQAGFRYEGANFIVFADNHMTKLYQTANGYPHQIRIHPGASSSSDNIYFAKNMFIGSGNAFNSTGTTYRVDDVWYEGNRHHINGLYLFQGNEGGPQYPAVTARITNNIGYGSGYSWPTAQSGWTMTNNTVVASATPADWTFDNWSDPASWRYIA